MYKLKLNKSINNKRKTVYTTSPRIEHPISHAIEIAWSKGKTKVVLALFGRVQNDKGKPTNSEFIAMMPDKIKGDIYYRTCNFTWPGHAIYNTM